MRKNWIWKENNGSIPLHENFQKFSGGCVLKRNCEKFMGDYVSVPESLFNMLYAGFQPATLKRDSCIDIFLPTLFPDIFNQIHWKEALLTSSIQKYFTCKIYDILVSEIIHFEIFSCLQENQLGRKYFVKFNLLLFFLISQCWECFMVLCIYSGV